MANKKSKSKSENILVVLFMVLAFGVILFLISTDIFTLFSASSLTLDHTGQRATPDQRGANSFTGQFQREANLADFIERFRDRLNDFFNQIENRRINFERPSAQNPPMCRMGACSQNPPVDLPPTAETIPPFLQIPEQSTIIVSETIEHGTKVTVIDFRDASTTDVAFSRW